MGAIPIRNIYYLLSYAWDLLEEADELNVDTEDLPQVSDLLARLLTHGTRRLLRRGMDRGYLPQTEVLTTLRGRVNFGVSARRLLLEQAKAQCEFEEFLPDLLHNQILKATINALMRTEDLETRQRADLNAVIRRMEGISALQVRKAHFTQVRLHRDNAHYRLLMNLCELVHDNLLVNEQTGQKTFRDFVRDELQMAKLFELFIGNFYGKETDWQVTPQERILWHSPTPPSDLLPEMHADAVLRSHKRVLIVECKFYKDTLQPSRWLGGRPKLHPGHLYQITAYLENLRRDLSRNQALDGLLVYPIVGISLKEDLVLAGNRVRVVTVDLSQSWELISCQLKDSAQVGTEHELSPATC